MRLHHCRAPLVALLPLLAVAARPAHADPPRRLEGVIPADAAAVLLLEDVPGLRRAWPGLPWVRAWNDPALQAFFAPVRELGEGGEFQEFLEESGAEVTELLDTVTGQVAVVVPDLAAFMEDEDGRPTLAVLAHVGDNGPRLTELLSRSRAAAEDRDADDDGEDEDPPLGLTESIYRGVTLHLRQEVTEDAAVDRQGWAVVNGVAVVAEPRTLLESMVGHLLDGGEGLLDQSAFTRVQARVGATSGLFFVNMASVVEVLLQKVRQEDAGGEPEALGITPELVIRGLGLDALDTVYLSARLGGTETRADMGLLARENRGLVKAMAFQPPRATPPTPLPADALQASITYFSIPDMWMAIKEMLQQINPMLLGMVDAQVAQFSAQLGVDLEKSLIGSLGTTFSSANFLPQPAAGQVPSVTDLQEVTIIEITDPAALQKGLDALIGLFAGDESPFTVSQAGDVEIRTLNQGIPTGPAGEEKKLAYAVTTNRLILAQGGEEPIRRILSAQAGAGPGFWSRPDVQTAVAALPAGASAVGYLDAARLLDVIFESLVTFQSQRTAQDGDEEGFQMVDPEARPDPVVIRSYFGPAVSGAYKSDEGLFFTWRLSHAGP